MKYLVKLYFLLISVLFVLNASAQHSSLYNFIANYGIKTLGTCAHPSNTILYGSSSIAEDNNYIYLKIVYDEAILGSHEYTNIKIKKGFANLAIM